jgi:hypothetical protein
MNVDNEIDQVRIAAVGMDERMKNVFRQFFHGPCKDKYNLVEEGSSQSAIIDLDGYRANEIWQEYRKNHPKQPVILLSLQKKEEENAIFLQKPLKPDRLLIALHQVSEQLHSSSSNEQSELPGEVVISSVHEEISENSHSTIQINKTEKPEKESVRHTHGAAMFMEDQVIKAFIGTAPDIDPSNPVQLNKVQYNPAEYLQSYLKRAFMTADEEKCCVLLQTPRGSIGVRSGHPSVMVNFSESQLRTLSSVPLVKGSLSVSTLEYDGKCEESDESLHMSRDALLWKSALWASRGRIPAGTTLDIPAFLRNWPNLTRLLLFPHAMRIAALWGSKPYSLLDTATALSIPQRYVFGFYSAANALDLADITKRNVDTLFEPPPLQENRKRGLFGRILTRLNKH